MLELVVRGHSSAEIAQRLHRSVKTIESHRFALGKRLGARNRVELVNRAIETGLVSVPGGLSLPGGRNDARSDRARISADRVLRFIDAGTGAFSGEDFFRALVSHLTLAFHVAGAFVAAVTPAGRLRSIATWGESGPLAGFELPFRTAPCGSLGRAEVWVVPAEPYAASVGGGWQSATSATVVPLFNSKRERVGTLGLVHDGQVDPELLPETVLRIFAGRAAAELELLAATARQQRAEAELGEVQRAAHMGVWAWRPATAEFSWSTEASRLLGIDHSQRPRSLEDLVERLDARGDHSLRRAVEEATTQHRPFRLEMPVAAPGAAGRSPRLLAMQAELVDGAVGGAAWIGTIQDITYTREVELALHDARTFAASVLNAVPSLVAVVDVNGMLQEVNDKWRAAAADAGLREEQVGGSYLSLMARALGDRFAPEVLSGIQKVLERQQLVFETEYTCILGETPRRYHLSATAMSAGGAVLTHTDVTERRQAEEHVQAAKVELDSLIRQRTGELGATNAALQSEVSRVRGQHGDAELAFERSPDLLCVATLSGTIKRANGAFCRALGYTMEELAARHYLHLFPENERERVQALIALLSGGRAVDETVLRMQCADGTERWVAWTCPPPSPETGEIRPTGRDVTARRQAEEAIGRARTALDEFLRMRSS